MRDALRVLREKGLTWREAEIVEFIIENGASNAAAANHFGILLGTVKFHLTNVYKQLGVENRLALILKVDELRKAAS